MQRDLHHYNHLVLILVLILTTHTLPDTTAAPILQRTLWPPPPAQSTEPLSVSEAQTTDVRDSIVFASVVAFSAAVRLITSEMPLSRTGFRNILSLFAAAVLPTLIALIFAFVREDQRQFSWIWAQLVMLIALAGISASLALDVVESAENVDERGDSTALRAMSWRISRYYCIRLPLALVIVLGTVAALVDMEGWDVLALSFAAVVLVMLGIEPKTRSVSPVFNRLPAGFPCTALAVRSLTDGKPLPIVYYLARHGISDTVAFEYSVYRNELLGQTASHVLLSGLIGRSLIDNAQENTTDSLPGGTQETTSTRTPLQTLWPWMQPVHFASLEHEPYTISILALYNPDYFEDTTQLAALWIRATARVPAGALRSLLALCGMIASGPEGQCISHHHVNQLWSQWLEVHAPYAPSGLGYLQPVHTVEGDDVNENGGECTDGEGDVLLQGNQTKAVVPQTPLDANFKAVISSAFYPGGSPELMCIARSLPSKHMETLSQRYYASRSEQGAVAGDWLTRLLNANQIDEIVSSQAEWSLLLGMPVAKVEEILRNEKLLSVIRGNALPDEDIRCCRSGLIVPGPGYGLLELIYDRGVQEQFEQTVEEAASLAFLARHAFDVVAWGSCGVEDEDVQFESSSCLPVVERPRYLESGPLQNVILEALMYSHHTAFLCTQVVMRSMVKFRGLNDYNNSQLSAYPMQAPTACTVLGKQICPIEDGEGGGKEYSPHLRRAELRLIAPERMAVLQLGISSFFAISALLRSL